MSLASEAMSKPLYELQLACMCIAVKPACGRSLLTCHASQQAIVLNDHSHKDADYMWQG